MRLALSNLMIKRLALVILLIVLVLPLSGCTIPVINKTVCLPSWIPVFGGDCDQTNSGKEITLTYWGIWEPKEVIQPLIEKYQTEHPNIKIDYQVRETKDYFETIQARMSTELTPDIIRVHNSWVPYLQTDLSPCLRM